MNILYYNYFFKYRDERKVIKNMIQNNDISNATTRINSVISEHDIYLLKTNNNSPFTTTDNKSLHHAKDHLDAFNFTNDNIQKDASTRALDEQ